MKKKLVLLALSSLILSGCGSSSSHPDTLFITFKDYDDSVLYHGKIAYGGKAVYVGKAPTRDGDVSKSYTFQGWDKDLAIPLYENTVFNAVYFVTTRQYTVTFLDYDGSLLASVGVDFGAIAQYPGGTPTRKSDSERIEYVFSGWGTNLESRPIVADTTFTAHYETKEFVFATFNNYDGSLLKREKVEKGEVPSYSGSTPTRSYSTSDKTYRFSGWDKSLSNIYVDTTYVAQFDLLNIYTVTFENYNGNVLQTQRVIHGEDASYTGSTPYRPSSTSGDYSYTYTFSGWSSSLKNITCDKTVTACFNSTVKVSGKTAIIEHLNENGSGSYHSVVTATYDSTFSTLGYYGSEFYFGGLTTSGNTESVVAISCGYGDSSGEGTFQIENSGSLVFSMTFKVTFENHTSSGINSSKVSVNKLSSDSSTAALTALALSVKLTLDDAGIYLKNHGLSYIC